MKKTIKKLTACVMAFAMMGTMPVYAASNSAESVVTDTVSGTESECKVYAEVASSYTVTLPKEITLNGATKSGTANVSITGDIAGNEYLTITPDSTFTMTQSPRTESAFTEMNCSKFRANSYVGTLAADEKKFSQGATLTVTAPTLTAGHWEGTFAYTIALTTD